MKKIEIYLHTHYESGKDIIDCMCKADNKGCEYDCDRQHIYYDEYQDLEECFENKGKKSYEQ